MKEPVIVAIDKLNQEPYSSVLCFPNASKIELKNRIEELRGHSVLALEFSGTASVFGVPVPVLGKGFVGIVVIAHLSGQRFAVKIRRTDADRDDLFHEANMLSKANSVDVAPKLVAASKNFLIMQLIEGELFPNWLNKAQDKLAIRHVLKEILEQCFKLDQLGLDHGELSKAPKHLLLDKNLKSFIVDFETASLERRVANVTAVCQYLFGGNSSAAKTLDVVFGEKNRLELIDVLKIYKNSKNRQNFESVLEFCTS